MKTLVIHPKDSSTDFLSVIYSDFSSDNNWTIITDNVSTSILKKEIRSNDRIIFLGHGTELGLLGYNRYIITSSFVYLLKDKSCVYIWCNADIFVKKYNLKGFYTGMIISEYDESISLNVPTNYFSLTESNKDFANSIKESLDKSNILDSVINLYEGNSPVVLFNRSNLYYQ